MVGTLQDLLTLGIKPIIAVLMQHLSNLLARRRSIYSVLIGIILLTLPCYVIAAIALAIAPRDNMTQPTARTIATMTTTATFSAIVTLTPVMSPSATLADLPTQFAPPTQTPTLTPIATATVTPTLPPLPTDVKSEKPGKPGRPGKPGK